MKVRVGGLIVGEGILVLAGLRAIDRLEVDIIPPGTLGMAIFVVVLAGLTLLPRIYLEHGRHNCWITPADGAIPAGLFVLGPLGFVVAALSAEVLIALRYRQPPLKFAFNLVSMLGGYTAAAVTFAAFGRIDPLDPLAWAAGLAAMAACALWDVLSTAALFAIAERRPFRETLVGVTGPLFLSLLLSAALGIVALVLLHETPIGVLLVVPVLGILVVSTSSVSRAEAEQDRLQRLFTASSNLARLVEPSEALTRVATEGRSLLTGAAAICVAIRPDGATDAVLVDDVGPQSLPGSDLERLLEGTAADPQGVIALAPGEASGPFSRYGSLLWANGTADPDVHLLLAVLHEQEPDERVGHRVDVLNTFVTQAATVLANVELHDEVREALAHEVALNRQKSEFVAAVSHELRTPLAGMIGALQTVQRSRERMTEEQLTEILEVGNVQGARLLGLIEDLLLVAAAEHEAVRVEPREVVVADVLERIAVEFRGAAGERLVTGTAEVGVVWADRGKLHRILSNLVDNARKYAPTGPIEISVELRDDAVCFNVDDHGPGVAPADRERVFERFVQLDQSSTRRQGGIGLGLHLSRELAELLGGELTVTDAPEGGARFRLTLPHGPRGDELERSRAGAAHGRLPASRRLSPGIISSPLRPPPALLRSSRPVPPETHPEGVSPADPEPVDPVPTLAGGPS